MPEESRFGLVGDDDVVVYDEDGNVIKDAANTRNGDDRS